jgi:hypothetical protein
MGDKRLLMPSYNSVPDSDPQIKRVDLDNPQIAGRKSAMPGPMKEQLSIKHVAGKS